MALVYALIDSSNPDEIRYIGKTIFSTKRRLYGHMHSTRATGHKTPVHSWMKSVLTHNNEVQIIVVEDSLTESQAFDREIFYIRHYRQLGHRLTNLTDGGEGPSGHKHTEEARRKIAAAGTGRLHTEESKQQIRKSLAGKEVSPATRQKIGTANTGNRHTEEARKKISAASTARMESAETKDAVLKVLHSKESRKKAALSNTGKKRTVESKTLMSKRQKDTMTEARKQNIREKLIGHSVSDETKRKQKEAWIARKARKSLI